MSIIIVKKEKDKIVIGADTQVSSGNLKTYSKEAKIYKINSTTLIASAGSAAYFSLLKAFTKVVPLKDIKTDADIIDYMSAFNSWFTEKFSEPQDGSKTETINDSILITNGKVFAFENFFVHEVKTNDYYAIGSGVQAAQALMEAGLSVENALKYTCKVDTFCSEPLVIHKLEIK